MFQAEPNTALAPEEVTRSTKPADVFETDICSRCLGTGEYSYNPRDGKRCFGCGGRKTRLTKRGAAAKALWRTLNSTPLEHVKVGERILDSIRGWATVEAITSNAVDQSSGRMFPVGDPRIDEALARGAATKPSRHQGKPYVTVYEGINVKTTKIGIGAADPSETVLVHSPDTQVAILKTVAEYQLTLTKTGKPRKGTRWAE
jgi:hypothetical protein